MTIRADTLPIDFEVDPDAEPGDVIAALAALLIEVAEAEDVADGKVEANSDNMEAES